MKIIAHRGARAYEPENTLAAFRKALEIGVDGIELDIFVLRDGELAVIHDIMLDRTTNGHGYVSDMTLPAIKQLDAGDGQQVPTLEEVIKLVDRKVPLTIEIKSPGCATPLAKLIQKYLANGWSSGDFHVISFNHPEIVTFRELCPSIKTGASIAGIPVDMADFALRTGVQSVMLCGEFLTREFVDDAHSKQLEVWAYAWEPYTADTESEIKRLQATGVDYWASDAPDRARQFLSN